MLWPNGKLRSYFTADQAYSKFSKNYVQLRCCLFKERVDHVFLTRIAATKNSEAIQDSNLSQTLSKYYSS